jgi:hypothetical protein
MVSTPTFPRKPQLLIVASSTGHAFSAMSVSGGKSKTHSTELNPTYKHHLFCCRSGYQGPSQGTVVLLDSSRSPEHPPVMRPSIDANLSVGNTSNVPSSDALVIQQTTLTAPFPYLPRHTFVVSLTFPAHTYPLFVASSSLPVTLPFPTLSLSLPPTESLG